MAETLGQTIVIDNKSGRAAGSFGSGRGSAQEALTLVMGTIASHCIAPSERSPPTTSQDSRGDAGRHLPTSGRPYLGSGRTVDELVAYAKRSQGGLDYGLGRKGSSSHLAGELQHETGAPLNHIPYRVARRHHGPARRPDFHLFTVPGAAAMRAGRLRGPGRRLRRAEPGKRGRPDD